MSLKPHAAWRLSALALALAGPAAVAQTANVTLFGIVDANVQRYSASGAASVSSARSPMVTISACGRPGPGSGGAVFGFSGWLVDMFPHRRGQRPAAQLRRRPPAAAPKIR